MIFTMPKYPNTFYIRGALSILRELGVALAPNIKSSGPIDDPIPRKVIASFNR
jgi:hypothetical protein